MDIVTIPCLYDNYAYLIIDRETGQAAVVDPSEAWPVIQEIERQKLNLTTVLCTHHHQDHIGGIDELLNNFSGLAVLGFHEDRGRIPQLTTGLQDGDRIRVGTLAGTVFPTPGHTRTHVVYQFGDNLFVGDTLFGAGCGRLFEGTAEQLFESLNRIVACGTHCRAYFGHEYTLVNLRFALQVEPGNEEIAARAGRVERVREGGGASSPSTVAEELQTNPFLRVSEPGIIDHLQQSQAISDPRPISVFAALRQLRNHFS